LNSGSRIAVARSVANERTITDGRVVVAGGVTKESESSIGCVFGSCGVALERCSASGRVLAFRDFSSLTTHFPGRAIVCTACAFYTPIWVTLPITELEIPSSENS
jgi:hypothetical protein